MLYRYTGRVFKQMTTPLQAFASPPRECMERGGLSDDVGGCGCVDGHYTDKSNTGVCLSPRECTERGGLSEGSCASGFGACCLFISRSDSYKTSFWTLRKYVALIKMSLVDQSIKVNQYFYSMETTGGGVAHLDSKVGYLQNPAYPQVQ